VGCDETCFGRFWSCVDKAKAVEDAYKSTMKKIPDQKKATNDPWGDVRGSNEPKAQKHGRSSSSNKAN
jgi:hypothetical protein